MRCYRIMSHKRYQTPYSFSSKAARWNPSGSRMIYAASDPAVSQVEYLCIMGSAVAKLQWHMIVFDIADETLIGSLDAVNLPVNWNSVPHSKSTQDFGKQWLEELEFPFLKVPTARMDLHFYPQQFNLLINPDFPDLQNLLTVVETIPFTFLVNSTT